MLEHNKKISGISGGDRYLLKAKNKALQSFLPCLYKKIGKKAPQGFFE